MTALRSIVIAAFVAAGFAGAAQAQARGEVFSVRIDGAAAQRQVIAQNTVWTCDGDTCRARPNHAASVRACRQFVRQTGARVISYGSEGDQLSAAEIARCNGDTETQQAAN